MDIDIDRVKEIVKTHETFLCDICQYSEVSGDYEPCKKCIQHRNFEFDEYHKKLSFWGMIDVMKTYFKDNDVEKEDTSIKDFLVNEMEKINEDISELQDRVSNEIKLTDEDIKELFIYNGIVPCLFCCENHSATNIICDGCGEDFNNFHMPSNNPIVLSGRNLAGIFKTFVIKYLKEIPTVPSIEYVGESCE